jgi:hypothetical protein
MNRNDFIEYIENKRGWVDLIDILNLISIYTDEYGLLKTNLSIENELIYMYNKLKEDNIKKN